MTIFDYRDNFKDFEDVPCELMWSSEKGPINPELSVVMPVYNNPHYFKFALESALNQDWKGSYEIVVVDNNESDEFPNLKVVEQVNDPRVRYYRNAKNIGGVGNWNRCIKMASGKYVTFLHDDDMFLPTTISNAMKVAKKYPGKLVISTLKIIGPSGGSIFKDSEYELSRRFLIFKPKEVAKMSLARSLYSQLGNCVGSIFNRDNLIAIGGFNMTAGSILDYELCVRYIWKYGAVKIRRPNALYRIANNSSSNEFALIAPKSREISKDMIGKIHLPKWILRRVADTHSRDLDYAFRLQFAKTDEQVELNVTKLNRRLTTLYCNVLNFIEAYRIALWK